MVPDSVSFKIVFVDFNRYVLAHVFLGSLQCREEKKGSRYKKVDGKAKYTAD
jgi:hypothetical protein